jgi:hypothetical protein
MRRYLLLAAALLALAVFPAAASAAAPGVNVSRIDAQGDPYVNSPGSPGSAGDTARTWQDIVDSGAKSIRTFVQWQQTPEQLDEYAAFAAKARAHGLAIDLVVTGTAASMATPSAYATNIAALAARLRGEVAGYEIWNEPDDTTFWKNGPQPADYAALLKAAYTAVKRADPSAKVLVGGLVGNDFDFLSKLYDNGAKGSFDAVAVHTDTACNTTDPTEYYREPTGRIGRYSFTGYREVHATMLAHGDDKPIWMTELGWSTTTAICNTGDRAGTKPGGVSPGTQATFLTRAYECLADDSYVQQALWFNLHDFNTSSPNYDSQLGLVDDGFNRKPAFNAFTHVGNIGGIPCGGVVDNSAPSVQFVHPADRTNYYSAVPVQLTASDAQGVTDVNLFLDGQKLPFAVNPGKSVTASTIITKTGSLSYGPHTLVAKARDAAQNVGTAQITLVRVGGGAYASTRIPSKLTVHYGKLKHRKLTIRGSMRFANGVTGVGTVKFLFQHLKRGHWSAGKGTKRSPWHPFKFAYSLNQPGRWRVKAAFIPRGPFTKSTAATKVVKVR